ncbi:hypothetical protein LTR56_003322 [Elasticomyces elasticus]|nr:hypothetical protein LTR56_003322 [Elasticomyces elasticus]KAK3664260.1 hypothetical protein LTR22_004958 [Elasticomyces elasticus]KAK4931476.1 hypothetical protein LTR49_002177 [Elasticomyces elasticus]KAK5766005.1 hypothetical protein LTS12_003751 [Elasticomyces elasticus]
MPAHQDDTLDTVWSDKTMRVAASKLYTPIKNWQIRILRLHSGANDDPLEADLLVAGLAHGDGLVIGMDQDLISYEAVSYSWGQFKPCVPITINGIEYRLCESLAGALHRFRLESAERYLWADALCIYQCDDSEKSAQVRTMFTIYHKAQRVLAWLGHEGVRTGEAIDKATQSSDMDSESHEVAEWHDTVALVDLCLRPWARRIWIQQEVFAAKELVLFCGASEMDLETYQKMAKCLFLKQEWPTRSVYEAVNIATNAICGLKIAGVRSVAALEAARASTRSRRPRVEYQKGLWVTARDADHGLAIVLRRCGVFEASDSRDLIFELLGLTNCVPGHPTTSEVVPDEFTWPLPFKIDYTMSVSEVFQQATRYILNSDRSLLLLSESGSPNLPPSDPLLPSWTIDWGTWQSHQNFRDGRRRTTDDMPDPARLLQWQPAVNDGLLRLSGIILGSVKSVAIHHEKLHDGWICCHIVWGLHDAVSRTYTSHHQDGSKDPNTEGSYTDLRFPGHIAVGDVIVSVDGCVANDTLCLRLVPGGKFRYVCVITDETDLRLMVKDPVQEECGLCDGGFDESLAKREFVVC